MNSNKDKMVITTLFHKTKKSIYRSESNFKLNHLTLQFRDTNLKNMWRNDMDLAFDRLFVPCLVLFFIYISYSVGTAINQQQGAL